MKTAKGQGFKQFRFQHSHADTEMELEFRYCTDQYDGKVLRSRLGRSLCSSESTLLFEFPFRRAASYILCINCGSFVLLLYRECRNIVLVRQSSNPHPQMTQFAQPSSVDNGESCARSSQQHSIHMRAERSLYIDMSPVVSADASPSRTIRLPLD